MLWKCLNTISHRKHQSFELLNVRLLEIFNALTPAAKPNNQAIRVKAGLDERSWNFLHIFQYFREISGDHGSELT